MIFGSTLPIAREFKRWITHEVLPSIRKTGSYTMELPHDYLSALEALVTTEKARQLAESQVKLMWSLRQLMCARKVWITSENY